MVKGSGNAEKPVAVRKDKDGDIIRGGSGELDKGDEWMIRARPA